MSKDQKVVDFQERRENSVKDKRRHFERVFFQEMLGLYLVLGEGDSQCQAKVIDISHEGLQIELDAGAARHLQLGEGDEFKVRFYFTPTSYLLANVMVRHHRVTDRDGRKFVRVGGEFDQGLSSYGALQSFIDFVYKFAEFSQVDKGSPKVYFL